MEETKAEAEAEVEAGTEAEVAAAAEVEAAAEEEKEEEGEKQREQQQQQGENDDGGEERLEYDAKNHEMIVAALPQEFRGSFALMKKKKATVAIFPCNDDRPCRH